MPGATMTTPREIDERLADLYYTAQKLRSTRNFKVSTALHIAGATYYYRGRQRVTDMTEAQAVAILSADPTKRSLTYGQTHAEALDDIQAADKAIKSSERAMTKLERQYTGWSRFFLVTSSIGHIHSSMFCSTCRPTTTYGWLPQLSDKTEAEAVAECGPALCSVCFPSAPTANTLAKLTAKQAADILAGKRIEAAPAKTYCPGSGRYADNARQGYAAGNWAECPVCHQHIGGGRKVRKHQVAS